MIRSPIASVPSLGTGRKLIARMSDPTRTRDRTPPRLSTGSLDSLTWAGTNRAGHHQGDDREGQRDEEHRAPVEPLEEEARDDRAARGDGTAGRRPQGDRARAPGTGPQRGNEGERRRVGHARGDAAHDPGQDQHFDRRGERGDQAGRDRQPDAEHDHELAAVAIPERAEPQDRAGEAERVADGDEVELRLAGVERQADRRQGDVRDGQVEVGDRSNGDERGEHEAAIGRAATRCLGRRRIGRSRHRATTLCRSCSDGLSKASCRRPDFARSSIPPRHRRWATRPVQPV